jgi:hypothetical protein
MDEELDKLVNRGDVLFVEKKIVEAEIGEEKRKILHKEEYIEYLKKKILEKAQSK